MFNIERRIPEYGWREPAIISFKLNFKANAEAKLEIKYSQMSGFSKGEYSVLYYLKPAKYWKTYSNLNIYIEMPDNYVLNSDMPFSMTKKSLLSKTYYMHSNTLPANDLYFHLKKNNNSVLTHSIIGFLLLLLMLTIFLLSKSRKRQIKLTNPDPNWYLPEAYGIRDWLIKGEFDNWMQCAGWQDIDCENNNRLKSIATVNPFPAFVHNDSERALRDRIYTDIQTYMDENLLKFMTGTKPMTEWDTFTKELVEKFKIEDLVNVCYQPAYERYKAKVEQFK